MPFPSRIFEPTSRSLRPCQLRYLYFGRVPPTLRLRSTRTAASFAPHEAVVDALKGGMRDDFETKPLIERDIFIDIGLEIGWRTLLGHHLEKGGQHRLPDAPAVELRGDTDRP